MGSERFEAEFIKTLSSIKESLDRIAQSQELITQSLSKPKEVQEEEKPKKKK